MGVTGVPYAALRHVRSAERRWQDFPLPPFSPGRVRFPGHTRAWLKIQEGCSHHCSYCIVPRVRGPRRSLGARRGGRGLSGSWPAGLSGSGPHRHRSGPIRPGSQPGHSLAAWCGSLQQRTGPSGCASVSLEPQKVTPELLAELAAWPDFCPHFHLPLQSGAAAVLAAMGRPYQPGGLSGPGGGICPALSRRRPGTGRPGGLSRRDRRRLRGHPGPGGRPAGDLPARLSLFPPARHPARPIYHPCPATGPGAGPAHAGAGPAQKTAFPAGPTGPGAGSAGGRAGPARAGSRASATTTCG